MSRGKNFLAMLRLWQLPLAVLLAMGFYFAAAYVAFDKLKVVPIGRLRVVEIKPFLDRQAREHRGDVYLLGSSVTVEGADCTVIDSQLSKGVNCWNLAWTGSGPRQWLLVMPAVASAKPSAVVLCVDLGTLAGSDPLPDDLLSIAGWWDFLPADCLEVVRPLLTGSEYAKLTAPKLRHLVSFRTFPLEALDAYAREVSRPNLRYEGYAGNFRSPWIMKAVTSRVALARELRKLVDGLRQRAARGELTKQLDMLGAIVDYFGRSGPCRIVIALTPVNPEVPKLLSEDLVSQTSRSLKELAGRKGVAYWDYSGLLPADEFSDSVHPFTAGRRQWSQRLGADIERILADGGKK